MYRAAIHFCTLLEFFGFPCLTSAQIGRHLTRCRCVELKMAKGMNTKDLTEYPTGAPGMEHARDLNPRQAKTGKRTPYRRVHCKNLLKRHRGQHSDRSALPWTSDTGETDANSGRDYIGAPEVSPTLARRHNELVVIRKRLPVLTAIKRTAVAIVAVALLTLHLAGGGQTVSTLDVATSAAVAAATGVLLFAVCSATTLFLHERAKQLSRLIYRAGFRVRDNGDLVTNEPNPSVVVPGSVPRAA